ncbi:hypothetical protein [Dactylosporangium sp. CA-092794]|uniref:hypothetical protein n=1 Tax=Dactylosporangium sp. CA-092794 TaxID=3239929 RepID=UPI003D8C0587
MARRRANEAKDGDPRDPAKWGPAQAESFQAAERGVFDKLGQVDPVAAQREGTSDTYQIIVKTRDGHEFLVKVPIQTRKILYKIRSFVYKEAWTSTHVLSPRGRDDCSRSSPWRA